MADPITALPAAPSRQSPSDFSTKADAFIAALPTFVTEANAVATAMNLNATTANSTTELTIGTGAQSLTVDLAKSFLPGMSVKIARTAAPSNWMHGDVTSYNSGTGALVVNVLQIQGSGTFTDWTVTFSAPGANLTETPLATGFSIAGGTTSKTLTVSGNLTAEADSIVNQDLTSDASPTFVTVKCSGLTNLKIPKHVAGATGLADTTITVSANNEVTNVNQPAFLVRPAVDQSNIAINTNVTVVFGSEIFNRGGNFASNTFTAPVNGVYNLSTMVRLDQADTGANFYSVTISTSNRSYPLYRGALEIAQDASKYCFSLSVLADMDAGDTAVVYVYQDGGTQQAHIISDSWFSGFLAF